jgi:hypothetical protein
VAALLELEGGAQPGLDLTDGQRDPRPGPGGRAELLADTGAEGVALALLMRVELGGDGGGTVASATTASWQRDCWYGNPPPSPCR